MIFDFNGVDNIGQGFADEVFRVFANQHPEISIQHVNSNADVKNMILHVNSARNALVDLLLKRSEKK